CRSEKTRLKIEALMKATGSLQPVEVAACDGATTIEMGICANAAFEAADRKLNVVYERIMRSLEPAQRESLREEQRAWLGKLRPSCEKQTNEDLGGGTLSGPHFVRCLETQTLQRTGELTRWAAQHGVPPDE